MKKLSLVLAGMILLGSVSFAQDAAKTPTKKTTSTAKKTDGKKASTGKAASTKGSTKTATPTPAAK